MYTKLLFTILMLFAFLVYNNYDFRKESSTKGYILDSVYQEHRVHEVETTRYIFQERPYQTLSMRTFIIVTDPGSTITISL